MNVPQVTKLFEKAALISTVARLLYNIYCCIMAKIGSEANSISEAMAVIATLM
jgi:hypothetical protein